MKLITDTYLIRSLFSQFSKNQITMNSDNNLIDFVKLFCLTPSLCIGNKSIKWYISYCNISNASQERMACANIIGWNILTLVRKSYFRLLFCGRFIIISLHFFYVLNLVRFIYIENDVPIFAHYQMYFTAIFQAIGLWHLHDF